MSVKCKLVLIWESKTPQKIIFVAWWRGVSPNAAYWTRGQRNWPELLSPKGPSTTSPNAVSDMPILSMFWALTGIVILLFVLVPCHLENPVMAWKPRCCVILKQIQFHDKEIYSYLFFETLMQLCDRSEMNGACDPRYN